MIPVSGSVYGVVTNCARAIIHRISKVIFETESGIWCYLCSAATTPTDRKKRISPTYLQRYPRIPGIWERKKDFHQCPEMDLEEYGEEPTTYI